MSSMYWTRHLEEELVVEFRCVGPTIEKTGLMMKKKPSLIRNNLSTFLVGTDKKANVSTFGRRFVATFDNSKGAILLLRPSPFIQLWNAKVIVNFKVVFSE
ncbi:hypothetical protein LSTR_LSTR000669 [Laodelphax striatellus]|uniref:Uncharacterized protein n=1 Tax=Laodelphax striatellus TaxID=195883 RepID=A0A482XG58_LAOST|nr:hypothetical protein LSTR_LSTR000669 [Laodelphax striatellus]